MNLNQQLRRDEGVRPCAYRDSKGYLTIGVGHLVDERKSGAGLPDKIVDLLLDYDIADRRSALSARLPWFVHLDEARQGALLNMAFQLGTDGLMGFHNMLDAMRDERYAEAETHALDSKWAREDSPARARRVARQLATGAWQ